MKELQEKEILTLSSVKKIPKMSSMLTKKIIPKSRTISSSVLSKSKPEYIHNNNNNNNNKTQPNQTSTTTLKRKIKTESKPVTQIDNLAIFDKCAGNHNIHSTLVQTKYNLCNDVWGPGPGGHSLPSLSQVKKLKEREPCTSVMRIPGHPYKYTVGSCLFDSTMFCLSRSKHFTSVKRYSNGQDLRAVFYYWALTTLISNGNGTLSDMEADYIQN